MNNEDENRYDFVLQERGIESYVKTVGLITSHTSYFSNRDVCNFILMKTHNQRVAVSVPKVVISNN